MEEQSNPKVGISYYVHTVLGVVPILGFIFTIILFVKAIKIYTSKAGKIFLAIAVALLLWNIHCSLMMKSAFQDMPPLDGTDQNHIHEQIKGQISSRFKCGQTDSINLNFVTVSASDQSIGYAGQIYACHKAYYVKANCKNKTDQQCTITLTEITNR